MQTDKTFACEDCRYYSPMRCKLWQVGVPEPNDSHCESFRSRTLDSRRARDDAEARVLGMFRM